MRKRLRTRDDLCSDLDPSVEWDRGLDGLLIDVGEVAGDEVGERVALVNLCKGNTAWCTVQYEYKACTNRIYGGALNMLINILLGRFQSTVKRISLVPPSQTPVRPSSSATAWGCWTRGGGDPWRGQCPQETTRNGNGHCLRREILT